MSLDTCLLIHVTWTLAYLYMWLGHLLTCTCDLNTCLLVHLPIRVTIHTVYFRVLYRVTTHTVYFRVLYRVATHTVYFRVLYRVATHTVYFRVLYRVARDNSNHVTWQYEPTRDNRSWVTWQYKLRHVAIQTKTYAVYFCVINNLNNASRTQCTLRTKHTDWYNYMLAKVNTLIHANWKQQQSRGMEVP